jgi:hypothetical protein
MGLSTFSTARGYFRMTIVAISPTKKARRGPGLFRISALPTIEQTGAARAASAVWPAATTWAPRPTAARNAARCRGWKGGHPCLFEKQVTLFLLPKSRDDPLSASFKKYVQRQARTLKVVTPGLKWAMKRVRICVFPDTQASRSPLVLVLSQGEGDPHVSAQDPPHGPRQTE